MSDTPRTRFQKGTAENDLWRFADNFESNAVVFKAHVMRVLDRAEQLERSLSAEKLKRQQAEHERDCAVEDVARLRMALRNIKDEADIYDIDVTETNVRSRIGAIHGLSSAALAQRSEV